MASTGFEYEVIGEIIQDYLCPVCLLLLRDAVELACTHTLCEQCMKKWVKSCKERYIFRLIYLCQFIS